MSTFHQYQANPPQSVPFYNPNSGNINAQNNQNSINNNPQNDRPFEYFNVSPDMINFGLSAGQKIITQNTDRWMPGVSGIWNSLKFYFAVNNMYVIKKISLLLYPLSNKSWGRTLADDAILSDTDPNTRKWSLPKHDTNSPDLYIPAMSFITYILLYGLFKGIKHGPSFSPDMLIEAIWKCLLSQLCETGLIMLGLATIRTSLPFFDIFAYTGYKYVALSIDIFARVFGSIFSSLIAIYTSLMIAYFFLRTLAAVIPQTVNQSGPPRHLLIIAFAAIQFLLALYLNWL